MLELQNCTLVKQAEARSSGIVHLQLGLDLSKDCIELILKRDTEISHIDGHFLGRSRLMILWSALILCLETHGIKRLTKI